MQIKSSRVANSQAACQADCGSGQVRHSVGEMFAAVRLNSSGSTERGLFTYTRENHAFKLRQEQF